MLDIACREAELVLLDQRDFALSEAAFKRFTKMLDKPPASNLKLKRTPETGAMGTLEGDEAISEPERLSPEHDISTFHSGA